MDIPTSDTIIMDIMLGAFLEQAPCVSHVLQVLVAFIQQQTLSYNEA
jgi:hypothetical protein